MGANTLIGNDVYNTKLEDLGDIKEIMLDIRTGRVSYAVVSFGGFLVRRPENTLNYFRVFCPECFVARRRHSPAMTPSRALPRDKIHPKFLQVTFGTPH